MKWEYKIEIWRIHGTSKIAEYLNRMGMDGWENYQAIEHVYYFKRPIAAPTIPPPIKD